MENQPKIITNHGKPLTEAQKRFVMLEAQYADWKQYQEDLKLAKKAVADEIGVGGMFQDEAGTVYKVVEPTGTYVEFKKIEIHRTRRGDEPKGSLNLDEAEAGGFQIERKRAKSAVKIAKEEGTNF